MALTQKRIRELVTYSGSYLLSSLYFAIDSTNFGSEPFKVPMSDIISASHVESDKLTTLASASVSITFDSAFTSVPLIISFKVYRYSEVVSGKWVMEDVKYHMSGSTWLTTTGFAITIDSSESLTGVIIEYKFEEA